MKPTLSILAILLAWSLIGAGNLCAAEQEIPKKIHDTAKELRRKHWVRSYENVVTTLSKVSLDELKEYTKAVNNQDYEEPLAEDQIKELFVCYHTKSCTLYLISLSADYMGGTGGKNYFVKYYDSGKMWLISHLVYSE